MLKSQAKLPLQEDGSATAWARTRQAVATLVRQAEGRIQDLPLNRMADALRNLGTLVSYLGRKYPVQPVLARFSGWISAGRREQSLLNRFALHLVVVLLAAGVVLIGRVSLPQVDFVLPTPTPAPELGSHTVTSGPTSRGGGVTRFIDTSAALFQAPVLHTVLAERDRMQVITYTVQPNDNAWVIAQGFGLQAETVLWANPALEKSPDLLKVGQVLVIPPVDGVYYTVQSGDTVEKLAKTFKTTVEKITSFESNGLEEPYTLVAGQKLMIPGGQKAVPVPNYYPMTRVGSPPAGAPKGSGRFAWPTQGYLSQRFWSGHPGIDIANRTGTPILAADAGYVLLAGQDTWGYGNQIVIDHGNGFLTRYAHLSKILVKAGDSVKKNQQIGLMGSTGRSTGPHLHFEVIQNGVPRNPQSFLP
jgi:murein DD-endopeptidase MepM/ murein hydrolase activator NlpD